MTLELEQNEIDKLVAYLRHKAKSNLESSQTLKNQNPNDLTWKGYLDIGTKLMSAADILDNGDEKLTVLT